MSPSSIASGAPEPAPPKPAAAAAPTRVAIAGGTALIRAALRALVERSDGFAVIADADELGALPCGDVLLLDIDDAPKAALEQLQGFRGGDAAPRVLVLTASRDPEFGRKAILAGARGVVYKDRTPEHFLNAIRKVRDGELWIDRLTTASLVVDAAARRRDDREQAKIALLTERERDVIALVGIGLSNKAIATRMGISDNTVRHHLTSIFAKLGVADRLGLAVYAFQRTLARPAD